jgi:alpha-D-xyloside xylohydrolase
VILVREGAAIPHATLAQSTDKIDWKNISVRIYGQADQASGLFCLPSNNKLIKLDFSRKGNSYQLTKGKTEGVIFDVK